MPKDKTPAFLLGLSLLTILCIGVIIQLQLPLNWDVSWLISAAEKMLAGGSFSNDFFSPNPPSTLLFYLPTLFIHNLAPIINIPMSLVIYVFSLSTLSIAFCYSLIKKIVKSNQTLLITSFMLSLACIFYVTPTSDLGQRDQVLLALTFPYILLIACRRLSFQINNYFCIAIGMLAGIGLSFKPQFYLLFVIFESYYYFKNPTSTKNPLKTLLRPESITILLVLILHLLIIGVFFQDYATVIFPYILRNYQASLALKFSHLITQNFILFSLTSIFLYSILNTWNSNYKTLNTVLVLALVSNIAIYLSQRSLLPYHYLNIITLTFFINLNFVVQEISIFPIQNRKKFYLFNCAILAANLLFIALLSKFLIILLLFINLFLSLPQVYKNISLNNMKITFFAIFMLINLQFFPILFFINSYYSTMNFKNILLSRLISFSESAPPHASYFFIAASANLANPLVHYTSITSAQSPDCLWMISTIQHKIISEGDKATRAYISSNTDPLFYANLVAHTLNIKKPTFVIFDNSCLNVYANNIACHHDWLSYLQENPSFRKAWKNYHYYSSIVITCFIYPQRFDIYKLQTEKEFSHHDEQQKSGNYSAGLQCRTYA